MRSHRTPSHLGAAAVSIIVALSTPLAAPAQARTGGITPFEARKAESLLQRRLPCLGCHALGSRGGALGPDLATVRQRRTPEEIARMVSDPQHTLPGTLMPHTPMPDEWRRLVIRYLGGAPMAEGRGATTVRALAANDTSGAQLYARFCTGCHGAKGGGDGPNAARLPVRPAVHASRDAMAKRSDDALFDTIAAGGWIMNRSAFMPAYGTTLAPAQIRALVAYIRTLCTCRGPAWSTDGGR